MSGGQGAAFAGFAPWIIYWVVADSPSNWLYAALCAVISAVILGVSLGRGGLKSLDVVTIVFFAGVTIAGVVVHARHRDWMNTYANTISSGVLAAMVLASLAFVPFTEQYARETAAAQLWDDPSFKRAHRLLTLMWGLVFAATAILGYVAVKFPETADWTDWVVPIVLILAAVAVSQRYPAARPATR
ncbi:MAG: hypothetical protein JO044_16420 [Mycobacteriaceae bacterium]|nr:hypothetical protein [Mycobacteriaceae bacterium]MBV9638807.1 hypothetical protein [Mycobacteriaceae bacterium]